MNYKLGLLLLAAHLCTALALPPCVCTMEFRPVCGSDGKSYSNRCALDCERFIKRNDLTFVKEGNCNDEPIIKSVCACPDNLSPVCGSDGKTYDNLCLLTCAASNQPGLTLQHEGKC